MKSLRTTLLPVLLATIWISVSEFFRNEFLLKSYWTEHYEQMGLVFPSEPINGAIWGLWSRLFAVAIKIILNRFSIWETIFVSWFGAFVLMWVVTGNMGVLPLGILIYAVPLSLLETFVAAFIIRKIAKS
jgi:hypothetical protein